MEERSPLERFYKGEDDTPYYAALGRFVTYYAAAEAAVHMLARKLSGLSDERARIMISGLRLGDVQSKVKSLLPTSKLKEEARKDIERCFTQLDLIAVRRDKLVHRLVSVAGNNLSVTNIFTAKSLITHESEKFSIPDLQCLQLDCMIIYARLSRVRQPSLRKTDSAEMTRVINSSWFYTPPPPDTRAIPRRRSAQSRQTPPESSHT